MTDGRRTAVLYGRVSTEEQAKSGVLPQQLERLREYATTEGYEVLEEVEDPGQSGTSLERPGLDRVRDLVAAGGVSVVLAQDRDRFAREPAYLYLLRQEFAEHGTKLKALNDRGDDSPEGELMDSVFDQFAKFERAKTAERMRRGRLRKAREGMLVGSGAAPSYGFRFNEARDGYVVDEEKVQVVRKIFRLIGVEGMTMHGVKRVLEQEGIPTPTGRRYWSMKAIRDIIQRDVYRPHTFEEVAALVSPEVAARLDPKKHYGVWWFNRRRITVRQVSEDGSDGRSYRRRYKDVVRPREEWIPVPVPDAGMPREWVDRAREAIKDNRRPSLAGARFWELSGGVILCGDCGCRMLPHRKRRSPTSERFHHYYRCSTRQQNGKDACSQSKSYRAEVVETLVLTFVSTIMSHPDWLRQKLEEVIEQEKGKLGDDPEKETRLLLRRLEALDRKRAGYLDLAADGIMSREELRSKLTVLDEERKTVEKELAASRNRREHVEELERNKEYLLEYYANTMPGALLDMSPQDRHRLYKMLQLRVVAQPDGGLEVSGLFEPASTVCNSEPILSGGSTAGR